MISKTFSRLVFISVVLTSIFISGCDLINPDEDPPSYIEVESFSYSHSPTVGSNCPSNTSNIRDVWVYVDDEFQGTYELPAKFPVLKSGDTRVILSPGILLNGIAATRSPYPFYRGDIQYVNLPENGTIKLEPVTSYFDSVRCTFCEDFEGAGFSLAPTNLSDTIMFQTDNTNPNNNEGLCGVVYLDSANQEFEIASTVSYDLPGANAAVYLELDYKINDEMYISLYIIQSGTSDQRAPIMTLFPTDTWKKVYVQLGYTVSRYPNATFKIAFGAKKDLLLEKSEFFLDNIKVVHF